MELAVVRSLAAVNGWAEVQCNSVSKVVGFRRGDERVNVYYTTGTVGTCVDHPRAGKTQLFRRNQNLDSLRAIFGNPRVHTGDGYYRRHSSQRPEPSASGEQRRLYCLLDDTDTQDALLDGWDDRCETLALGSGYFVVQRDGDAWWSGGIPRGLYNKVNGRQKSLPPVDYVALGPGSTFFVQFTDGSWQLVGPASLGQALHKCDDAAVEVLAFAPDDGW